MRPCTNAARPHPLSFLSGVIAGGVVLWFGLDIHFFHLLPNCPVGINHPLWIIMSIGGVLMIIVSIGNIIRPPSLTRKEDEFDSSGIGDPIARKTEWTPIEGGANFCTYRLVKVGGNRLEFQLTREGRAFFLAFILIGFVLLFALSVGLATGTLRDMVTSVVLAVLGCAFTGFGVSGRCRFVTTIIFDRTLCLFWKGRGQTHRAPNEALWRNSVSLSEVHALQLVSQYHPSERGSSGGRGTKSYFSYELILILENANRISVVHHGGRQEILDDATTLSQFLGRPLWNGITEAASKDGGK